MKNFIINWDGDYYSVPTRLRMRVDGVEYVANPDKAHYIITPNEEDVIVYKDSLFFKPNGERFDSDEVLKLFQLFKI